MILRLKGVIIHDHDTKLLGEDGEGAVACWGIKPSPKVKPFEDDPGDTPTYGWGNRPNPRKDPTSAYGWGNRPNHKKESHVHRHGRQSGPRKEYTHPMMDGNQTRSCGDTADGYSHGQASIANGRQTGGCTYSVFR